MDIGNEHPIAGLQASSVRSGAVEAWRAHNPQVPRSKLGSEIFFSPIFFPGCCPFPFFCSFSPSAALQWSGYRFDMQAFIIYEESIPDSNSEKRALHSIVGALQRCTILSAESRDTLVHKATGYSAKLLKKADQCRAVCACSHLFWQSQPQTVSLCFLHIWAAVQPPFCPANSS